MPLTKRNPHKRRRPSTSIHISRLKLFGSLLVCNFLAMAVGTPCGQRRICAVPMASIENPQQPSKPRLFLVIVSLRIRESTRYLGKSEHFLLAVCTSFKNSPALVNNKYIVVHLQAMTKVACEVTTKKELKR